jgi:hypothetical protein
MMIVRRGAWGELGFGALALALVVPLWSVRYPPFQDFPQYVALARTLADYSSPGLGFERFFELNFSTYALFPAWLSAAFALVFGPLVATKLLVSLVIVSSPWALRLLLRALGRPVEYALFVLPLAYNAHVVMGFLGYVVAVTLMLWGLVFGVIALEREHYGWRVAQGIVALACLYSHVVPFAFLMGGLGLAILVSVPLRSWWRHALPSLPALLLFARGLTQPDTGWSTLPVGLAKTIPNCPIYDDTRVTFAALPDWVNDIFASQWDDRLLIGMFVACVVVVLLGTHFGSAPVPGKRRRIALCMGMLAPAGFALYFIMPRTCDWIWPIHARFLFVAVMLAVLVLPALPRMPLRALALALSITALAVVARTTHEFRQYAPDVGDLQPALAVIPVGKLVAALTFDKQATAMRLAGFHHFGAYCQAERGGLTMFSFATMPHWPTRVRPELQIPAPSWNFQFNPVAVHPSELDWAEYLLTRGVPPRAVLRNFTEIYQGQRWHVFRRSAAAGAPTH